MCSKLRSWCVLHLFRCLDSRRLRLQPIQAVYRVYVLSWSFMTCLGRAEGVRYPTIRPHSTLFIYGLGPFKVRPAAGD